VDEKKGRKISVSVFKQCLFVYIFSHFAWIFPFYSFLLKTRRETLDRKFQVAIRTVYRSPYISVEYLFIVTEEKPLDNYTQGYIKKRLEKMYKSDLGGSLFLEDIFYWDGFRKRKEDSLRYFFRLNRVKKLIKRHEIFLIKWIHFVQQWSLLIICTYLYFKIP
jgi:hypothetical protein